MSARNVPAELLIATFRLLERSALRECLFVCKTWHSLITPLYFEEIPLNACTILLVKTLLALPKKERKEYFRHGYWVKKLTIQFDNFSSYQSMMPVQNLVNKRSFKLRPKEFLLLLSYFPHLRVVDATDSHYFTYYMECLADSNQKLQRLEQIPCDMHENSFLPNLAACYNYRQSLTRLKTVYNASSLFSYTYQSNDDTFISLLSAFKYLTHLDLYNETPQSRLSPFRILSICPNLVRLKFHTKEPLSDNELFNNQPESKLKQLEITAPSLSALYVNYIITHVCKDLDDICIRLKNIDFCSWILQLGECTADKLARLLSKKSRVQIICSVPKHAYRRNFNGLKMTLFYRFLGVLRSDRDMYCIGAYDDFDPSETEIRVDGHHLSFRYGLDLEDFSLNEGGDVDRCESSLIFIPDTGKSVIGPDIIHHLAITTRRENEDTLYQALKYALTQCPHLCRFELENNASQIFGMAMTPVFNPRMSKHDTLKKIKLVGRDLSKDMVGLLSTHLPGVREIMTEFGDEDGSYWTRDGQLDVTGLASLDRLCLDTRTMIHGDVTLDNLSIHLDYSNTDSYYNMQKQPSEIAGSMDEYTFVSTTIKPLSMFSIKCNSIPDIIFSTESNTTAKFKDGQVMPLAGNCWGNFFQSTVTHF